MAPGTETGILRPEGAEGGTGLRTGLTTGACATAAAVAAARYLLAGEAVEEARIRLPRGERVALAVEGLRAD
ncbi:MAG: cobalt-precorrin-5B (C(1))-methyltransferase, partial [Thiohalospira sp.]